MALPSFVENATSLDDGMANKMAGSLSKLRIAQTEMGKITADVAGEFETLDSGNLPNLPSVGDIQTKAIEVNADVQNKMTELSALNDLTGGCLDTALGAATDVARDGLGFIAESLDIFNQVNNMPANSVMDNIQKIYRKAQEFANSLGIDQLIADMNGLLTCESASSIADDVNSEVFAIMNEMGLDTDGKPDPDTYYTKMKREIEGMAAGTGIPTSFTNDMSAGLKELASQTNAMATLAKDEAAAQISSVKAKIKSEIPPTPTPPSFF